MPCNKLYTYILHIFELNASVKWNLWAMPIAIQNRSSDAKVESLEKSMVPPIDRAAPRRISIFFARSQSRLENWIESRIIFGTLVVKKMFIIFTTTYHDALDGLVDYASLRILFWWTELCVPCVLRKCLLNLLPTQKGIIATKSSGDWVTWTQYSIPYTYIVCNWDIIEIYFIPSFIGT